jgi:23S rRNA pseudouridine2605 synthase
MPGVVPLERALSKLGLASRAVARRLIAAGRVTVDDVEVTDPLRPVVPERIRVVIDGAVHRRSARRVLAFHKPRGVVTTRHDPEGRQTVFDLLGEAGRGLVAVGRLDLASTGLLIFTNDTQLAHRLTDPARRVPRRYVVTVRGRLADDERSRLLAGIDVSDAAGRVERLSVEAIDVHKASARETHLIVTLVEGKNREIRRLFEAIDHEVTRLHRVAYGQLELGSLAPGRHRDVTARDIEPGGSRGSG